MTIKEMTIEQLKVLVYDHSKSIQASQRSIELLEQEILKRKNIEQEKPAKEGE